MPYPRKWVADYMEDTHTPREEWEVVVSDVTVGGLVTSPLSEE